MSKLKRLLAGENGIAMATVVCMIALLTVLAAALIDQVTTESDRAATAVTSDAVYEAADAGINDYIAKLLDDPQYYDHYVANGEATRTVCSTVNAGACGVWGGTTYAAGSTWPSGTHWGYRPTASYPDGKSMWYAGTGSVSGNSTLLGSVNRATSTLTSGYAYDLMITPPSTALSTNYITIVSTGCRLRSGTALPLTQPQATSPCDPSVAKRTIEVRVRRATPADFQYIWGDNQSWGSNATTYGTIYVIGDICHAGTAYGALEATGNINTSSACGSGYSGLPVRPTNAPMYTTTPQTNPATQALKLVVKPGAIDFSNFVVSLSDIKSAATLSGMKFDDSSVGAWRFAFQSNGTVQVYKCTLKNGADPASSQPTCTTSVGTYNLPSNGAIYTGQTAIVSWPTNPPGDSIVNGRVTLASNDDIVIGGNIYYYSDPLHGGGPNDDVLGLIANNNVYVANWVPTNLTWRAAVIAETGARRSYSCPNDGDGSLDTANFYGSVASSQSGCMTLFQTRNYYADPVLQYLFPPWFPIINGTEATVLYHEVLPSYTPPVG